MTPGQSIQVPIDVLTGIGVPLLSIAVAVISSVITSRVTQARHAEQIASLKERHHEQITDLKEWIQSVEERLKSIEKMFMEGRRT